MRTKPFLECALLFSLAFLFVPVPTPPQESDAGSVAEAPKHPDTKAGLQQFLDDMREAAKANDSQKLMKLFRSTEIPNCAAWLHSMYESDKADSWMSLCDARTLSANEQSLGARFARFAEADGEFVVRKVNDDPEPGRGLEWGWLQAIRRPLDIYFASWKSAANPVSEPIGYFVFVDGKFRWESTLQVLPMMISTTGVTSSDISNNRLSMARAQYYTPTTKGLKSFRCEAEIDWKALLTQVGGTEIPDDNPWLKYLQTVHLSVVDQLRGKGSVEWSDNGVPPEGKEQNVQQMRDGLQTMMAGFFQSWNAYMNGSMVPFPDKSFEVMSTGDGIHVHGTSNNVTLDEDFDKNMLLTLAVVETPELNVVARRTYLRTDDGLIVSSVASQVKQPPSAAPAEVSFSVKYGTVDSFRIPSQVVFDIKNVGVIEVRFNACEVSLADLPAAEKSGRPIN